MSANINLTEVRNPYPEWQAMAGDMNCWNCYRLLWFQADVLKHLCSDCQRTCLAVEPCLGCNKVPCECATEIANAGMHGR